MKRKGEWDFDFTSKDNDCWLNSFSPDIDSSDVYFVFWAVHIRRYGDISPYPGVSSACTPR